MSQAIVGTKTAEIINTTKRRKNKIKAGDTILINKTEPTEEGEILELTPAEAKKLMPKKIRTEKQKENDKRMGERMKERKRENQLQKEKILTETIEDKSTQMIKIKAPKKYRKKPVVIQEQDDEEEQKSSSDEEEIKILKKNVKKLSQKNELLNEITKIKNSARSTTPSKNPYDDMLNRYF